MRDCNQCGKCCTHYGGGGGLSVSADEIALWQEHRPDIARYARDGEIWISPVTGRQMDRCPWLRKRPGQAKYGCRIYADRPQECRHYPVTVDQMVRIDCEMLQPGDLRSTRWAQNVLDRLMADSRPPSGSNASSRGRD